jgi:hypothetical protein
MLKTFAYYATHEVFGIVHGTRLGGAIDFFIYDTIKLFFLLTVIIFIVSVIRICFPPEKTKRILSHKKEFIGNIMAALLGTLNPFCSCSAVPLFIGFVEAATPLEKMKELSDKAVKELGIDAKIQKISEIQEIMKYTMSTPGLVVNGKLKHSGNPLPGLEKIKYLIKAEA